MSWKTRTAAAVAVLAVLAPPLLARAGDGRIEIHHDAVIAAGGYPYMISQPGSYLLTSDLVVPDANTDGVSISATGVTLDLNGFAIRGPVTCATSQQDQYNPSTITCSGTGAGDGITGGTRALLRNGRISGFGRWGVQTSSSLSAHVVVEDLRVDQNAQGGIYFSNGIVRRVDVTLSGGDGIFYSGAGSDGSATMIEDSNIALNLGDGIGAAGKIRDCRIGYNGGAGIVHSNAGGQNSSISDNHIYRNKGKAINAHGSYRDNEITGNDSVGGQVIGTMSDEGGNNVH